MAKSWRLLRSGQRKFRFRLGRLSENWPMTPAAQRRWRTSSFAGPAMRCKTVTKRTTTSGREGGGFHAEAFCGQIEKIWLWASIETQFVFTRSWASSCFLRWDSELHKKRFPRRFYSVCFIATQRTFIIFPWGLSGLFSWSMEQ